MAGAPVRQVIPVDDCDDRVTEPHPSNGLGQFVGLVRVQSRWGLDSPDGAESAAPGTYLASDHERRGAPAPAVVHVGASGLLAHRVQPMLVDVGTGL